MGKAQTSPPQPSQVPSPANTTPTLEDTRLITTRKKRPYTADEIENFEGSKAKKVLNSITLRDVGQLLQKYENDDEQKTAKDLVLDFRQLISIGAETVELSSLKIEHEYLLSVLPTGDLIIGTEFKPLYLSNEVKHVIGILRKRWSIVTECGCRTMIDLVLLDAINSQEDNLVVFIEHNVAGLVGDTHLKGALDYMIAPLKAPGVGKPGRQQAVANASHPDHPRVVVIEAKKAGTIRNGRTQLLGEMKVLYTNRSFNSKIFGILTDGITWMFAVLEEDGINYSFVAQDGDYQFNIQRNEGQIVALIASFMRAKLPEGVKVDQTQ